MPTEAAPSDQQATTVEIDGLARAMMANGFDSETITAYLIGRKRDRDTSKFLELLDA